MYNEPQEQENDLAQQWRKEQLERLEKDPEAVLSNIKSVLGEELFEKTFGSRSQQPSEPAPAEQDTRHKLDADGVTLLEAVSRVSRLSKDIDAAVSTLGDLPFTQQVKEHVQAEIERLPAHEQASLTKQDIIAYANIVAGLMALQTVKSSSGGQEASKEAEQGGEPDKEEQGSKRAPDFLRAPRSVIDQMADALRAHGFTDEEIEAMCE